MKWKYILIVVILAVIVGGGILAYQYWWIPKEEVKAPEEKLPEKVEDETANWKIYRNEEFGFEFTYPSAWDVVEEMRIEVVEYFPDTHNAIYVTEAFHSLEEWLGSHDYWSRYYDPESMVAEPILIGGEEAFLVEIRELVLPMTFIGIRKGERLYIIESNSGLLDVLSTFKFIE